MSIICGHVVSSDNWDQKIDNVWCIKWEILFLCVVEDICIHSVT